MRDRGVGAWARGRVGVLETRRVEEKEDIGRETYGSDVMIKRFRELRVYRDAFRAAQAIYEASQSWPREERYALTDQIRRSSRSVNANIAEAWRKRRYPKHFVSKLTDADAEAAETRAWLDFALGHHYISQKAYDDLDDQYDKIQGSLVKMMRSSDKWCGPASLREPPAPYIPDGIPPDQPDKSSEEQ